MAYLPQRILFEVVVMHACHLTYIYNHLPRGCSQPSQRDVPNRDSPEREELQLRQGAS